MPQNTRKLRASIKAIFEPAMEEAGFVTDYPNFRRDRGETIDFVDIQYWTYGGAFILNAARFIEPDKLPVPREKVMVGMAPYLRQERFGPRKSARFEKLVGWFKYSDILDDRQALDDMMNSAAGLIPQIDAWLETGTRGPNVDPENTSQNDETV